MCLQNPSEDLHDAEWMYKQTLEMVTMATFGRTKIPMHRPDTLVWAMRSLTLGEVLVCVSISMLQRVNGQLMPWNLAMSGLMVHRVQYLVIICDIDSSVPFI